MKYLICFLFVALMFCQSTSAQSFKVLSLKTITHDSIENQPNPGRSFGISSCSLGDLNNDGYEDILVGGRFIASSGDYGGAFVLFLDNQGNILDTSKIVHGSNGFFGQNGPQEDFGESMTCLGDLDGDGTIEVAIGAQNKSVPRTRLGGVWILSIDSTGFVTKYHLIGENRGGFTGNLEEGQRFGGSLSYFPDMDGDGIPELLVGSPGRNTGFNNAGRVYLLYLKSDGNVKSYIQLDNDTPLLSGELASNQLFGTSLTYLNDIDNNGFPEIIAGAPNHSIAFNSSGAYWILFLDSLGNLIDTNRIHHNKPNFVQPMDSADIGDGIANMGDMNGDGIEDIAIGCGDGYLTSDSTNLIKYIFLNSDGSIVDSKILKTSNPNLFAGVDSVGIDFSGRFIASLNDMNGDAKRDLIVGVRRFNNFSGKVMLLTLDGAPQIGTNKFRVKPNFNFYPNPTQAGLHLETPAAYLNKNFTLEVFDAQGQKIKEQKFKAIQPIQSFDFKLKEGVYILKLYNDQTVYTSRILFLE